MACEQMRNSIGPGHGEVWALRAKPSLNGHLASYNEQPAIHDHWAQYANNVGQSRDPISKARRMRQDHNVIGHVQIVRIQNTKLTAPSYGARAKIRQASQGRRAPLCENTYVENVNVLK